MLKIDKPIIKPEEKIVFRPGDKTTFLNDGVKYSDLCRINDYYSKGIVNVKRISKPSKKVK